MPTIKHPHYFGFNEAAQSWVTSWPKYSETLTVPLYRYKFLSAEYNHHSMVEELLRPLLGADMAADLRNERFSLVSLRLLSVFRKSADEAVKFLIQLFIRVESFLI